MEATKIHGTTDRSSGKPRRAIVGMVLFAGALSATAGSALAHHSFAMFDYSKTVTSDATVMGVQWSNPHVWIDFVGPDAGKKFGIEGPSPNILIRHGWKRSDVKPGDKIAVTYNPLKDGSPGGVMKSLKLADGRVLDGLPH